CCSAAKVYAFEPNAASFEILKRNCILNGMAIDNLHNIGVGKERKTGLKMSENEYSTKFGTAINISSDTSAGGVLRIDKLDNFNFDKCDIIKIDVEGWEIDVLLGAQELIRKFRPIMWIEIEETNFENVANVLKDFGYFCAERLLEPLTKTLPVANFV